MEVIGKILVIFLLNIFICFPVSITENVINAVLRIHERNSVFKKLDLTEYEKKEIIRLIDEQKDRVAILALISAENFWQDQISEDYCIGLMQVGMDTIGWCRDMGYVDHDAVLSHIINVQCGITYFNFCKKKLKEKYGSYNFYDIVHAYNAGINKCFRNKENGIVLLETQELINRFNFYYTHYSEGNYEVFYKKNKHDYFKYKTIEVYIDDGYIVYDSIKINIIMRTNSKYYTPKGDFRVIFKQTYPEIDKVSIRINHSIGSKSLELYSLPTEKNLSKYYDLRCIRLKESDILKLYSIVNIGDYIIIK